MAIEVMKRYENKYLISQMNYNSIINEIKRNTTIDPYNQGNSFYTISNIYYDTSDNNLIRTSLQKPIYKEKLRLRAYGVPQLDAKVFLEIKKKFSGVVNKRRTKIRLNSAYEFLQTKQKPQMKNFMNNQVINELYYFINYYDLEPKVYLAYDRCAFFGENELRITFDKNIRTRRYDLHLENGDYGEPLLDDNSYLLEIKTPQAIPLWLTKILTENEIKKVGFSKYGTEFKKYLKGREEECLNNSLIFQPNYKQFHGKALLAQSASLFC